METNRITDSYGIITKEEKVCSLNANILEGSMVLESLNPFPGYHGKNMPDIEKPRSLFLILEKKYQYLQLGRILRQIRLKKFKSCNAAFGKIKISNHSYYCIRIKNLDCFQSIPEIQKILLNYGISMMKYHPVNADALIEIHKPFLLRQIASELYYKDESDPNHYYFRLSRDLDWAKFKKITLNVKNNIDQNIFDAAKVVVCTIEGPIDMIRIYEIHPTVDRLNIIRARYEYEISNAAETLD